MPTQSKEAPGELALVRAFVNTRDVDLDTDAFSDPAALSAWLAARGLLETSTAARPADVRRAVALREALRELLLGNNDGRKVPPESAGSSRRWHPARDCGCASALTGCAS